MRYKIYQIITGAIETDDTNMFNRPVYQIATKKLVELGFKGAKNDFESEEDAYRFLLQNNDVKGFQLTILSYFIKV